MTEHANTLIKTLGGMLSGLLLEYYGVKMILEDITSAGTISIKLFSNEISAVDIGVVVIFMGVVLQIMTIRHRTQIEKYAKDSVNGKELHLLESRYDGGNLVRDRGGRK